MMDVEEVLEEIMNAEDFSDDLSDASIPASVASGLVSLSFDDGWSSHYDYAKPILDDAGIDGTFYINTVPVLEGWEGYLTLRQVQALNAAGHEIGSHTSTHAHLPGFPESDLRNEVAGSREEFAILGFDEPATFAYPYGEFDEFARSAVAASGYSAARGVDRGYNTPGSDPYNLQIYQVDAGTNLADVQNWVDEASANDDWLILMFHQVDYSGDAYGTTPEVLQGIADYLNENQVSVATVESGASLLF